MPAGGGKAARRTERNKMLRLLCFNIHGGRSRDGNRDLLRVRAMMDHLDIDIAAFQEMETRASRRAAPDDVIALSGPDRPHHLAGPTIEEGEGWYGNLIVSRHPILVSRTHIMETKFDIEPRNAIDALIGTPLGPLRLINTHLSLSPFERAREVPKLIELVQKVEGAENHPVLLMGDINEWRPESRLLRFLNDVLIPVPTGPSFPSFCPFLRLDRVWHDDPRLRVTARVLDAPDVRILSDHLPLLIEVSNPV
jgi:endonuclease/exonuclease/phosphatase family metal-dependent hydrolase